MALVRFSMWTASNGCCKRFDRFNPTWCGERCVKRKPWIQLMTAHFGQNRTANQLRRRFIIMILLWLYHTHTHADYNSHRQHHHQMLSMLPVSLVLHVAAEKKHFVHTLLVFCALWHRNQSADQLESEARNRRKSDRCGKNVCNCVDKADTMKCVIFAAPTSQ